MSGPGYQEGGELMSWWKVAMHLDEAQLAFANAMAHNVDDPRLAHALYDRLREGQAILLEIFRAKRLLPGAPMLGSPSGAPMPGAPMSAPMPVAPMPVAPMPVAPMPVCLLYTSPSPP